MESSLSRNVSDLRGLVEILHQAPGFAEVLEALGRGASAAVDGAWGSSSALVAATLAREAAHPPPVLLVVLPRLSEVDDFALDLSSFLGTAPQVLSAWDSPPGENVVTDPIFGSRLRLVREWQKRNPAQPPLPGQPPCQVIVTCFPALLQPVPGRQELDQATRTLQVGQTLDPEQFARWLVECGFHSVPSIEYPGEFSFHGGIFDLFATGDFAPIRIEFFGDEIESIRRFEVDTQRKIADLNSVELVLLRTGAHALSPREMLAPPQTSEADSEDTTPEKHGRPAQKPNRRNSPPSDKSGRKAGIVSEAEIIFHPEAQTSPGWDWPQSESLLDSLPAGSWIVLGELAELVDEGKHFLERLDHPRGLFSVQSTLARCTSFPTVTVAAIAGDSYETSCHLQIESIERFRVAPAQVMQELSAVIGREEQVLIACHNDGERERLAD